MVQTKNLLQCAVFAAILCICSVVAIPIGAVPVSLGLFGVLLCSLVLGAKNGALSTLIFILLGAVGLPVFGGFRGGFSVLTELTGGYITGYIPTAFFVGFFSERIRSVRHLRRIILTVLTCIGGVLICYSFGTLQFMALTKNTLLKSLLVCVAPFIPFDFCKCILAGMLSFSIKKRLTQNRVHRS